METNIRYKEVDLVVVGNYCKGETGYLYDSDLSGLPDSGGSFEVTDVFVRDSFISVLNLFTAENLSEMEELAIIGIEK